MIAYDVDVYRTRLEWRNELDPDNEFDVSPCDFEYKEYYVNALKRAWKKEYDPYDEFKHIDLELIDDVDEYKEQVETYREWVDTYGDYNLDPSQFDEEDEYLDALRKLWKEKHDYFNEFNLVNPRNYSNESDYLKAIENKKNWINKCDPEGIFSKIDPSKYDNMFQYQHVLDLRKALKNKYDPDNIHNEIDPCDYSSVEEYYKALMNN
mgnify:CR=1 FL=1